MRKIGIRSILTGAIRSGSSIGFVLTLLGMAGTGFSQDLTWEVQWRAEGGIANRSEAVDDAESALGGVGGRRLVGAWGDGSLRGKFRMADLLVLSLEAATRTVEEGEERGGGEGFVQELGPVIRRAELAVQPLGDEGPTLSVGVRPHRYLSRFGDEAFFLDLGGAESAFAGLNDAASTVTNETYRDRVYPVGILARFDTLPARMDAFFFRLRDDLWEAESPGGDRVEEIVAGGFADVILDPERLRLFALGTGFLGAGDPRRDGGFNRQARRGSVIGTAGGGAELYLGARKELQVFGEAYAQFGALRGSASFTPGGAVRKSASAWRAGVRWAGVTASRYEKKYSFEVVAWEVSGDGNPADRTDRAFQSYEAESALEMIQGDRWGLDIDTNYRGIRATLGGGGWSLGPGILEGNARAGFAWFVHAPRDAAGNRIAPRSIGSEFDVELTWRLSEEFSWRAAGAWLADSDALDATAGRRDAWVVLFGFRVEGRCGS